MMQLVRAPARERWEVACEPGLKCANTHATNTARRFLTGGASEGGGDSALGSDRVNTDNHEGGPGVEAVPSEPEDEGAEHDERGVVSRHIILRVGWGGQVWVGAWYHSTERSSRQLNATNDERRTTTRRTQGFSLTAILPVRGSKRPARGPRTAAPMSAATPPTMCTTPQPAKSMTPTPVRKGKQAGCEKSCTERGGHGAWSNSLLCC